MPPKKAKRQERIKAFKRSRAKIRAKKRTFPRIRMAARKVPVKTPKTESPENPGDYDYASGWRYKSAHPNENLNEWKEANMKQALKVGLDQEQPGYQGIHQSVRRIATDFDVPNSTLLKRIKSSDYENYRHASGGKGKPRVLESTDEGTIRLKRISR